MQHQDDENEAGIACDPTWIHVHHLVSYCTRSTPGLSGNRDNTGEDGSPSATAACSRQNCVFRLRRG
ncbi:MAG TPA: hypothetical protein VGE12_16180 [Noviherbaspirillum sp.]